MRQKTSELLYDYWNFARNGRLAPYRYEIDPAQIATLLPEIFLAKYDGPTDYSIRLAGTRICYQLGRELTGKNLLDFWSSDDREALACLLHIVVSDGAVASAQFAAQRADGRAVDFEMTAMPLFHNSHSIDRILGSITTIGNTFWLGNAQLVTFELKTVDLIWPDGAPMATNPYSVGQNEPPALRLHSRATTTAGIPQLTVLPGGLSD